MVANASPRPSAAGAEPEFLLLIWFPVEGFMSGRTLDNWTAAGACA